jgi:tetraacyldisaccharide 4'-kinase
MKLNKPKYWSEKFSLLSILLFPITLIVILVIFFKKKIIYEKKFNIPVICVGNIYIGGTGKTPASILLAKELLKSGMRPVILRKFYKSHIDEHNLIRGNFNNLILNKSRAEGIKEAEKENYNTVILDDGFQDYKIKKDLTIVCFSQDQLIGNGFVIPSGPLRESLNSLKRANIILINGEKDHQFEKKILKINKKLKIFYAKYKPTNIEKFKDKKLLAVAGIGNPQNFFKLLEKNNLTIKKKLIYPDHYEFTDYEIQNIIKEAKSDNCEIVMTEKDYYKVKHYNINMDFLKVSLEIDKKEEFMERIFKLYGQSI